MQVDKARKTYYQLVTVLDALYDSNPLMSEDEIMDKTDYIVEACVVSIINDLGMCDCDESFVKVLDAVRGKLPFGNIYTVR